MLSLKFPPAPQPSAPRGTMASPYTEVASKESAEALLVGLRSVTWPVRNALLFALEAADSRLWMRCVMELTQDEVYFSALVCPSVDDSDGAIALPDRFTSAPAKRRRLRYKQAAPH